MALEKQFFNACITIDYPCNVGTTYIDPCTCSNYFLCEQQTNIISRTCGSELMWDHVGKLCDKAENVDVIKKLCDYSEPQNRCSKVHPDADVNALKQRCTGVPFSTTPITTTIGRTESQTGSNGGAIAGGIIGALLIIAIIVLVAIFLKRRNKGVPISQYLRKKKTTGNTKQEETYTEIGEVFKKPVYNGDVTPSLPHRPGFTMSPALQVSQESRKGAGRMEEVAYDNPGYTPSNDDIIHGSTGPRTTTVPVGADETAVGEEQYSPLDSSTLEVPTTRSYTPLSFYTRAGAPPAPAETPDYDYQVPRPMKDYYELDSNSNSIS